MSHTLAQFNYDSLPKDTRQKVRDAVKRVREFLAQGARVNVEIGKVLRAVQAEMPSKDFPVWVQLEFSFGMSHASNCMRTAEMFGDLDCLEQFQGTAIFPLLRKWVPQPVRDELFARARRGEQITQKKVRDAVEFYRPVTIAGSQVAAKEPRAAVTKAKLYVERLSRNMPPEAFLLFVSEVMRQLMELRNPAMSPAEPVETPKRPTSKRQPVAAS